MTLAGRTFIARHAETVFNASARMQGMEAHTPLTRTGFRQAEAMGEALHGWLEAGPALSLWSSGAGRTLQTLAVIAEHIGADWHQAHIDARLNEIDVGEWVGRYYADIEREIGRFVDFEAGLFTIAAPGGETYADVGQRLRGWVSDQQGSHGDRLIVTHGMTARILRGLLLGLPDDERFGAPVASRIPQGSIVMISDGEETLIHATLHLSGRDAGMSA